MMKEQEASVQKGNKYTFRDRAVNIFSAIPDPDGCKCSARRGILQSQLQTGRVQTPTLPVTGPF